MNPTRTVFILKALFLAANAAFSGMLCWDASVRGKALVLALPLLAAACLWRRGLAGHFLAALGASLVFFGFQSYSVHAQTLHHLASWAAILLLALSGPDGRPGSYGPLRIWLLGFVGVMLAGLPLLPLGEYLQAFRELGPLGFARMAAYSTASSSFYALASLDRLALYALFAWELAGCRDRLMPVRVLQGVAASLPAALIFGLSEYFLARGKAFAMNDRLSSLFLNPGWFAEYVCVGFPFLLLLGRGRGRGLLYGLVALMLAAMVLTMARAAWLVSALLAVALVAVGLARFDLFALHYRRMAKGVVIGLACVAVVAGGVYGALSVTKVSLLNFPLATMIGKRLERFAETPRPTVFKSGVLVGMESPVSGMGYETYAWHYPHLMAAPSSGLARGIPADAEVFEATHNLFIQVFAGGGLAGLAAWLLLAGRAAQLALRVHRRRADPVSLAVLFSLAAFHLFGLFQEMIYIPAVWLLFFAVLAWCMAAEDSDGGWVAPFTERRAARAAALAVLGVLLMNLSNAGYARLAGRLGLDSYPAPGARDLQGLTGPEAVNGQEAMWSSGASSFVLAGEGPWRFRTGAPHPDLAARPVRVSLRARGGEAASVILDEASGRTAELVIPAGAAKPGQRVYMAVSRLYCPLASGIKDHRALGAWISGPGLTLGHDN